MKHRAICGKVLCRGRWAAILVFSLTAWGQAPKSTTQVNSQKQEVDVRQGTVVYVSGNDLVVKRQDGGLKHYVVPSDYRFNIDGQSVATKDLKPGTLLTQKITTTTQETTVTNVRNVDARVRMVSPPYVTVTLADGTTKRVKVPDGTKFTIDGESKTVFDLREGMNLKGTIVTESPEVVVSSTTKITGKAPVVARAVSTPEFVGVLLIEETVGP